MANDLRYALRVLARSPGFTAIALVTLALGIGANTAIFSVVNGVLLRPLPFADSQRVVKIWTATRDELRSNHSAGDFLDLQRENRSFAAIAGYRSAPFTAAAAQSGPVQFEGTYVTADFFDVLRAPTLMGRVFARADPPSANARAVVLSRLAWQQLFGESADAIGQTIRLNGQPHTVVGVLGPHAEWPQSSRLWILSEKQVPPSPLDLGERESERDVRYFEAIGRLAPGIGMEQMRGDLGRLAALLQGRQGRGSAPRELRAAPLREDVVGDVRPALLILQAAVGLVLLVSCANVSSLLIARATGRRREIAIRFALGAGRGRIIRHLLAESLILGLSGGAAGLLLGVWMVGVLVRILPEGIPRTAEIVLDQQVAAVTLLISLATGILFGVVPALQASKTDANRTLKATGERGSPARAPGRAALVVGEIALTMMLLVAAGLLINSFLRLQRTDTGLQPEHVTVMSLALPQSRYPSGSTQTALYARLVDDLSARPEIQAAAVGFPGPLRGSNASGHFFIEKRPSGAGDDQPFANIGSVSGTYFKAMGIPLLSGRTFQDADRADAAPVAIVNAALARRYWPGQDAIGRRLRFDQDSTVPWTTVVGIVGDVRQLGLAHQPPPILYIPYEQFPLPFTDVAVRSTAPPGSVAALMRSALGAIDPDLPAGAVASLDTIISRSIEEPRFRSLLLSAFAATALLLAAVGVYGLVSCSVTERRREIGIRVALGARPGQVIVPVIREGLVLALAGAGLGVAGSVAASRVLGRFLFEVSPGDPATFGAVAAVLLSVALIATYIPSRRALRVDPITSLRSD